ncbi:hypothetical protein PRK78_000508 [Emydomyces testavorans]|uniref:BZIP domain-containing protein n=1 Tax=Emydomyces testavorans TaxID=2070801 RepID=A0AAF0DBA1_9EURO|nr:hypothetical protein PRK78_000508 [Emydomyces testavorans]
MEEESAQKLRTIRHKENKRRYRARQREYVESLQQRLADARDQQVAGMREVQQAGQKVANDNSRLRTLLRFIGVQDAVVESWLHGVETPARLLRICDASSSCSLISKPTNPSDVSTKSTQTCADLQLVLSPDGSYPNDTALEPVISKPSENTISSLELGSLHHESPSSASETPHGSRPCMSVPHILNQPNTESQGVSDLVPGGMVNGDIECSRAQRLILPFATTSDKVDAISTKLKEGCVSDGCGGCKVKANVMWEALDEAMKEA